MLHRLGGQKAPSGHSRWAAYAPSNKRSLYLNVFKATIPREVKGKTQTFSLRHAFLTKEDALKERVKLRAKTKGPILFFPRSGPDQKPRWLVYTL